jgi:hypothetical protein
MAILLGQLPQVQAAVFAAQTFLFLQLFLVVLAERLPLGVIRTEQ